MADTFLEMAADSPRTRSFWDTQYDWGDIKTYISNSVFILFNI